jgi:hypothetical protein
LSEMKKTNKQLLLVAIPVLAFFLFWILRSWDSDQHQFDFAGGWMIVKNYLPMLALCWLFFQSSKGLAGRTLFIFSSTIVVLLAIAIIFGGKLAMWCIVGIGLFTSIVFSKARSHRCWSWPSWVAQSCQRFLGASPMSGICKWRLSFRLSRMPMSLFTAGKVTRSVAPAKQSDTMAGSASAGRSCPTRFHRRIVKFPYFATACARERT